MDSTYLGVDGVCVLDEEGATDSISTIKTGINILKAERSMVGARQNRCLCAVRVDDNVVENSSAAESLIRDTDMAKEMVKFSKQNILEQVGQSMLAQANQSGQSILSLLQ